MIIDGHAGPAHCVVQLAVWLDVNVETALTIT